MRPTRGAAILATAAVLIGGLTACGEDEPTEPTSTTASPIDKGTESSSSTSDGASSSTSVTAAQPPPAAQEHTKAGAIAFNKFYFTQIGEALHSGNPETIEAYSDGCPVCENVAEGVREDAERGIRMNRNPYTPTDLSASKRSDGGYRVELTVDVAEYHEVDEEGSKGRTADAISLQVVTDTRWKDGQWVMRDQVRVQ